MKTRLLYFLFLMFYLNLNAQWSQVGNAQFTDFVSEADFTFDVNGVPYVVYDDAVAGTPKVKKFDGASWVDVGDSTAWGTVDASLLAIAINPADNQPWVAWKEGNSFIDVFRFDGTNWIDDNPINLYVPTSNTPLEFVFDSANQPVIYYHKSGGTSSLRDYFRILKQPGWVGQNVRTGFSSSFFATTDKNGESILNELGPGANSSQIRALDATTNIKFTVAASNVGVKRFNKLSKINFYWVGNDILNSTSGITFGLSSNLSLPQPINTSANTGNYIKLVERTQGNLMYLMFSDASNQLQIQRFNIGSSQWSVLPTLPINTSASGFIADIEVNETDNNLYVLYQDSGRISMQKFEEVPALQRYYVNANASGGNGSGDSWVNAMTSLSDALGAADDSTTEIWVATGTYKPGTTRTATFGVGIDNIQIFGGFNGTETLVADRDIINNPTILSGDINGDDNGVSFTQTTRNENSFHVMDINANNVTVDGFQVNDGHANGSSTNAYGGAVLVRSLSENLTFKNCEFNQNVGLTGGAIRSYLNVNTGMTFENCIFYNNLSRYGSGLYFLVNDNRTVTIDMTNCLFSRNRSADQGSNTGFTGSTAWIRANGTGSNLTTTITNCTFGGNTDVGSQAASEKGPLALSRRTDGNSTHNATINNSIFYHNQVSGGATGISINRGHVSFPNTIFVNNAIGEDGFSNLSFLTNTSNANPNFTDAPNYDFTLQGNSPAIDAGNNSLVPAGIIGDLLFNQRIHNGTVDMGAYEFGAMSLSTEEVFVVFKELRLFPNPVKDELHVTLNGGEIEKLKVFNLSGQKVLQTTNTSIDVSHLTSGIYILNIETNEGVLENKRFIKN